MRTQEVEQVDTMAVLSTAVRSRVESAATAVLETYADAGRGVATDDTYDAGPVLLASLAAGFVEAELVERVLVRWTSGIPAEVHHLGSFEGLAGLFAGATAIARVHPPFGSLSANVGESLRRLSADQPWRTEGVGWADYDLISGPAGVVLALLAGRAGDAAWPAARHLIALCDQPDLSALRLTDDANDDRRRWNVGRINTGMGHGLTGVIAALTAIGDAASAEPQDEVTVALHRLCTWLVAQSYVDTRGLRTWPPAGLDGSPAPLAASSRQAWCYGTPGVAWAVWNAGRVLLDADLQSFAEDAMRSFQAAFDPQFHLDTHPVDANLGLCHGAAGILAVADAFARHAQLPAAGVLRQQLTEFVVQRLAEVEELAGDNLNLLTGAGGILAVLLTTTGDTDRAWLTQIALR